MGQRVLILGIGNLLWADEGFGPRCVERLAERHAFGPEVTLMDGGTQGLYLLPFLEEADLLPVPEAAQRQLGPRRHLADVHDTCTARLLAHAHPLDFNPSLT